MNDPIPYSPSVETPEPDEAETVRELIATLLKISEITYRDGHHALRSVHAKSHALLEGQLTVLPDLPPELAQGMFAACGYLPGAACACPQVPAIFSTTVSPRRGVLAIKVIGVKGIRLPGSETATDAGFRHGQWAGLRGAQCEEIPGQSETAGRHHRQGTGAEVRPFGALRGAEKLLESVGGHSGTLRSLGGEPATQPIGRDLLYPGTDAASASTSPNCRSRPARHALQSLKGAAVKITEAPNALRDAMQEFFTA